MRKLCAEQGDRPNISEPVSVEVNGQAVMNAAGANFTQIKSHLRKFDAATTAKTLEQHLVRSISSVEERGIGPALMPPGPSDGAEWGLLGDDGVVGDDVEAVVRVCRLAVGVISRAGGSLRDVSQIATLICVTARHVAAATRIVTRRLAAMMGGTAVAMADAIVCATVGATVGAMADAMADGIVDAMADAMVDGIVDAMADVTVEGMVDGKGR